LFRWGIFGFVLEQFAFLALALELLVRFPELEALLGPEIPFDRAPDLLPPLLAAGGDALCPLITYA